MSTTHSSPAHTTPTKRESFSIDRVNDSLQSMRLPGSRRAVRSQQSTPGGRKSSSRERTPLSIASPARFNRALDWRRRENQISPTKKMLAENDVFGSPSSSSERTDFNTPQTIFSPNVLGSLAKKHSPGGKVSRTLVPRASQHNLYGESIDPQAKFLPSACVFVANLPAAETDDVLQTEVYGKFAAFGAVHVKIRRDSKRMPYAFCQFEDNEAAIKAVELGPKLEIVGRPCRTEYARVNRTLYVSLKSNERPDAGEVRKDFEAMGQIDSICFPTQSDIHIHVLRNGAWVKFTYWQHAKDAYNHFRQPGSPWVVEWPEQSSSLSKTDDHSIFVGNLDPAKTSVPDMHELFKGFGDIDNVDINIRPSRYPGQLDACFAFIRFRARESVPAAILERHGFEVDGRRLHVSRKEIHPKSQESQPSSPFAKGSPVDNRLAQTSTFSNMNVDMMRDARFMPTPYGMAPIPNWMPMSPYGPAPAQSFTVGMPPSPIWSPNRPGQPQPGPQLGVINGQLYQLLPAGNHFPMSPTSDNGMDQPGQFNWLKHGVEPTNFAPNQPPQGMMQEPERANVNHSNNSLHH